MQKNVHFIGSSQDDIRELPEQIRREFGQGLYITERGGIPLNALPLVGFKGTSVMELRANDPAGTYRCMYTVKFKEAVYILHVFQKKSRKGISTPKQHIELLRKRLKSAEDHYGKRYQKREENKIGKAG